MRFVKLIAVAKAHVRPCPIADCWTRRCLHGRTDVEEVELQRRLLSALCMSSITDSLAHIPQRMAGSSYVSAASCCYLRI